MEECPIAKTQKPSQKLVDPIMEKYMYFKIKITSPSGDGELSFRTSTPNILDFICVSL
jgi:hypothetical protein